MYKPISIVFLLLVTLGISACAQPAAKAGSSPDEQRSHVQKAQDELSSEVNK